MSHLQRTESSLSDSTADLNDVPGAADAARCVLSFYCGIHLLAYILTFESCTQEWTQQQTN